jgi:hypothetical protein
MLGDVAGLAAMLAAACCLAAMLAMLLAWRRWPAGGDYVCPAPMLLWR